MYGKECVCLLGNEKCHHEDPSRGGVDNTDKWSVQEYGKICEAQLWELDGERECVCV